MRTIGGRRRALATIVMAGVLSVLAPAGGAHATETFTMTRIAGDSRYATAAQIAIDAFGTSSGAIIATGEAFPDALAASFIAGYVSSPILLVERNHIPDATTAALTQLEVKEVVLLGGSAAISDAVQAQLDETYEVVRLSGPDRFATAANIALAVNPGDIGELDGERTAFVTYGYGFADALAVGPLAYAGRFPILLNGRGPLGTPARVALDRLDITHVVIIGGIISDVAVSQIQELGISTERVQGADRFATAAAVADFALERLDFVPDRVDLVRGIDPNDPSLGFADALAGSVHAGRAQGPLLLTHPDVLSPATLAWLERHADELLEGDILGGGSAVSADAERDAVAAAQRVPRELVAVDLSARTYSYNSDNADGSVTQKDVEYHDGDAFSVDGQTATIDAFEAALSVGDLVRRTTADGVRHALVNGA